MENSEMTSLLGTWDTGSYARTAWLRGASSAFDLSGNTRRSYHFYDSVYAADFDAMKHDWETVGTDVAQAIATYHPGHTNSNE